MKRGWKQTKCNTCNETTYHSRCNGENLEPQWECRLCGAISVRIIRKSAKRKEIEAIVNQMLNCD